MSDITIWHNPRCSKSRAALALLQERGDEPKVRRYLDDPPTIAELRAVRDLLGVPASAMMRLGEAEAKALNLGKSDDDEVLIAAMIATPKLIERPIVLNCDKAAIGRPTEAILAILE